MFNKVFFLLPLSLLIVGCATPYQDFGMSGGVEARQLNDTVFQISAVGNGYVRARTIKDYALLKSSEVCLENNFRYFIPIDASDAVSRENFRTDLVTNCYGNSCYTSGGQHYAINKPSSNMTIQMFGDPDESQVPSNALDCELIYESLAPKYIK